MHRGRLIGINMPLSKGNALDLSNAVAGGLPIVFYFRVIILVLFTEMKP